jgi:hypothetical protein
MSVALILDVGAGKGSDAAGADILVGTGSRRSVSNTFVGAAIVMAGCGRSTLGVVTTDANDGAGSGDPAADVAGDAVGAMRSLWRVIAMCGSVISQDSETHTF